MSIDFKLRPLITGAISYAPALYGYLEKHLRLGKGNTTSSQYCVDAYLSVLAAGARFGMDRLPARQAELGPGATLGTGLLALLCGAHSYRALDLVAYADWAQTGRMIDELAALMGASQGLSHAIEFPDLVAAIDSNGWPSALLTPTSLRPLLSSDRPRWLKDEVTKAAAGQSKVLAYRAPWTENAVIEPQSVDFVFSIAVLEHVEDLDATHRAIHSWLAPGAWAIHRVDFGCHGVSHEWNGHWTVPKPLWTVIRGKRAYSINRHYLGQQRDALERNGFEIVGQAAQMLPSSTRRQSLASEFRMMRDEDLQCRQVILVARKRA